MGYPNLTQDVVELQTYIENIKTNIIDFIYPVGSIYMSVNNVSPATFLGGKWEQIQDTFLLSAGSKHSAGSIGGEETHTLSVAETPAHTHTRGTMDITGTIRVVGSLSSSGWTVNTQTGGAFYEIVQNSSVQTFAQCVENTNDNTSYAGFQASRNWTGETSSVGGNTAHNNMPPYLTVYMWKRIS